MQHLEDGLLHELVDGEVPSEDLAPIQRHLAECPACRARLDAARDLAALTDGLIEGLDAPEATEEAATPVVPLPVRRTASRWSRGVGLAASLTVAVGVGWAARDLIPPPDGARPAEAAVQQAPTMNGRADAVTVSESPTAQWSQNRAAPPPSAPAPSEPVPATPPSALATSGEQEGAREQSSATADARLDLRAEAAPPMLPQAARAPAASLRATGEGQRTLAEEGAVTSDAHRQIAVVPKENALVPRDADRSSAKAAASPVVIEFAEAVALLGGHLRLIEGLVPSRLERLGDEIRVIYPISTGNLILSQQRVGEELRWRLIAPAGYAADSLDALRRRVGP